MAGRGDAGEDYYSVLGVSPDASVAAIRAAYRDRVKQTHPDLNDAPDATEQFQRVKRAKEVLTDEEERERYDRLGHDRYVDGTDGGTGSGTDSGGSGGRSRQRERARWTAEGWADPGRTGGPDEASAGAGGPRHDGGRAAGQPGGHATRHAAAGDPGGAGGVEAADLGDRITLFARMLERYRFDLDPTTAVFGMATFFLYPVFLASSVTPRFPIAINLLLLCCLLCTVGYLLATPEVGVPVFGAWSLFGPIMFIFADRPLLSWAGFFLVAATFVPFGLSVMILELLQVD